MSKQTSMFQYAEFVEKFKPKKTTDDCYTPALVYEAVLGWVVDHYGIDRDKVDRPFWPGGDFENFNYTRGGCVVDNPPFSLLASIVDFYNENKIKYFLFSPYLTNFSSGHKCCHVITPQAITYENGAKVDTAFVTNLDDRLVLGDTDLFNRLKEAEKATQRATKKQVPVYTYPDNVITAADVGYMVKHGVNFELKQEDAIFIRGLDSQLFHKKSIFGGGFLVSEEAARKRTNSEQIARENARENASIKDQDVIVWELSERERQIIEHLGKLP